MKPTPPRARHPVHAPAPAAVTELVGEVTDAGQPDALAMRGESVEVRAYGLRIESVQRGSALARVGVRAGDVIVAVDRLVPRDVIDLQFELPEARSLVVERTEPHTARTRRIELTVDERLDPAALTLTDAVPGGIRQCNNHCEFCFIRGLPRGLRSSLYIFDDDYRYSFLWGNFLTLTNLSEKDWARIGFQRLSPLNVSVHATDPDIRRRLLKNPGAPAILPQLARLARLGIRVNAQVVLCADLNDKAVLDQTIGDLASLHPTVQSLSIVPVGLTRYSRVKHIRRPTPEEASAAVGLCERWQASLRPKLGVGFVYPSDELYVLAGRQEPPPATSYDGFPVLSNGVGLVRSMLDEWQRLLDRSLVPKSRRPRAMAWLTGGLAAHALERMADEWHAYAHWRPTVHVISNRFFGEEVSVSGLLSGADLIQALSELPKTLDDVVLPRGAFGFDGRCTIDGVSAEEVGAAHPGRVHLASTPAELLQILTEQ